MDESVIYSVTQLNTYIKEVLDSDAGLSAVTVRGEISNYTAHSSGHHYFSLKDETGVLKCVMFRGNATYLRFRPQNGMKVVAMGRVSVYTQGGAYQLYVSAMMPEGVGDLRIAFDQLKARLEAEGLFDPAHKKPLPTYPKKIALITSPEGEAVWDMIHVLEARWPMSKVCVMPVRVQGAGAAGEISRAIDYANAHAVADLIITGRGGGSMEDLWSFNEEIVARAIYRSAIPVITAVGHDLDVSIADYVADLSVATPTKAAVNAVPDQNDVYGALAQFGTRLDRQMSHQLTLEGEKLRRLAKSRALSDPMNLVTDRRQLLERQHERLSAALKGRVAKEKQRFAAAAAKLDALSPLKVLGRGYAIPQVGDRVISSVEALKQEERFTLRLRDGSVPCRVEKG